MTLSDSRLVSTGSPCYNQKVRGTGQCRQLRFCPWAVAQIKKQDVPQVCSYRDRQPVVCCPVGAETIFFPSNNGPGSGFLSGSIAGGSGGGSGGGGSGGGGSGGSGSGGGGSSPFNPSRPNRPGRPSEPGSLAREMCKQYERYVPPIRYGGDNDCVANHTYPVGGNPALAREFPHMALLGYGRDDEIRYECGGTLIAPTFVLTAAHCLFGSDGSPVRLVVVGDLVLSRDDDDANPQRIRVVERIQHPEYKPPSAYNDIALLRLQREPDMRTPHVRPACLHVNKELEKEKLVLTGWGRVEFNGPTADELMEVALYRTKYPECAKAYGKATLKQMPRGVDDDSQLCAGAGQLNKDACQGDSGGPLQTPVNQKTCMYQIAGVTSLGQGCGFGAPGVYTRVSYFVPWIETLVWGNSV